MGVLGERLRRVRSDVVWRGREQARLLGAGAWFPVAQRLDRVTLRAGLAFGTRPSAEEVIERYAGGWVLFGLERGRFEWRYFDRRAVITTESAIVPKRIQRIRRKLGFEIRFVDDPFEVVEACRVNRTGWLTAEVASVYRGVHELGCLAAIGAYQDGVLVGGHWGIVLGTTFGGMSMFHTVDYAGAMVLATLSDAVASGEWSMLDCGKLNDNFRRYGAHELPTAEFSERVWRGIARRAELPQLGQSKPAAS